MVKKASKLLIDDLYVHFPVQQGWVRAVDGISLEVNEGEFVAILGESGCGKSVLGQAILQSLPAKAKICGKVYFNNYEDNTNYLHKILSLVPQNPSESFCPTRKIGRQMEDIFQAVGLQSSKEKKSAWLRFFGLQEEERVMDSYAHQLSGGMQQRVLCAMAVSSEPQWILADEPTKGLDEKNSLLVYQNLLKIKKSAGISMVLITHDLDLARQCCDKIALMYAGQIMEYSSNIFQNPLHPYTKAFLAALPENGFQPLMGKAPQPTEEIKGCKFAPRCPYATSICQQEQPSMVEVGKAKVRCFLYA